MAHTTKSSRKRSAAQSERFREKARELECDEDEAAFDAKLKAEKDEAPQRPNKGDKEC